VSKAPSTPATMSKQRSTLLPKTALPALCTRDGNKKLSYRRGTAQRAMLVDLCYALRGMGVRKVSSDKSNLRGHSRSLAMESFDRPHTITY